MTVFADAAATLRRRAEFRASTTLEIIQLWGRQDAAIAALLDAVDNDADLAPAVTTAAHQVSLTIVEEQPWVR